MKGDKVYFFTDNQRVSLYPTGLDSSAVAPKASKIPRLVLVTLALMLVTAVTSFTALFVVVLQHSRPAPEAYDFSQGFPGNITTEQLPVEPDNPFHSGRVAELQEAIQIFKNHVENSSTWSLEIHLLTCRVDNVSSQIQMLSGHLKNASADVQMLKSILKDASTLHFQTQMLKSNLEEANSEIQKQRGDLETANALNSQTQSFLKSSLANTSLELHMLSRGLENADTEIQALKAGLEMANAQAQLANTTLKNANAQILVLRGNLDSVNDLRAQNQVLRNSLKGTNTEIQRLKEDLENTTTILTMKIQEEHNRLENLSATFASQEQLQKTQNQLLQLILQGWNVYGKNLYYFSHVKKSWHMAEQFCVSHGAHLASVTSQEEQAYLVKFTSTSYHWIGLTDSGKEGAWRWVDETPFNSAQSRAFWSNNQPDNWRHSDGQTEDCVHIQQKWNDMNCNSLYHWVCKKSISQDVV